MRLFLSYVHVDKVRVASLAGVLGSQGFDVSWDDQLAPGDDWKAELMRWIHACDALVCVISDDFGESEYCEWELAQAIAIAKPIVPVVVRRGAMVPRSLSSLQYIDASELHDDDGVAREIGRLAKIRHLYQGATDPIRTPHGFPARFTHPLPKDYRTVSQGYLRPAAPSAYTYEWLAQDDGEFIASRPIVGIDFGTAKSSVALTLNGRITLVPDAFGETSMPSAVAIDENGSPLVGTAAARFLLRHPNRGVLEVKRLFGYEIARLLGGLPVLEVDGVSYTPADLAGFVLLQLRRNAEAFIDAPVQTAVLTVPAYFDKTQADSLLRAAKFAGLTVARLIPEPVAACLGARKQNQGRDSVTVVYDLGGGTFDVSVVECSDGVFEVRSVNGDTHLGGADFDRVVVGYCVEEFKAIVGLDVSANATTLMRLRDEVERAKIDLSSIRSTAVSVPYVAFSPTGPLDLNVELSRTRYNELTHGLVMRTVQLTQDAIDDAAGSVATVDDVLVVGRAAQTPSVRTALKDLFGDRLQAMPDHAVAIGAAVQAAVFEGTEKDTLLLDTLARTLRVQLSGGRSVPVVVRNTTIPTITNVRILPPRSKASTLIRLLSGEHGSAEGNVPLADLHLEGQVARDGGPMDLHFEIDANSEVRMRVERTATSSPWNLSVPLRGTRLNAGPVPRMEEGLPPVDDSLLPTVDAAGRLGPFPLGSLSDPSRVQRWLANAAVSFISAGQRRTPDSLGRYDRMREDAERIRQWLADHPEGDVSPDVSNWSAFRYFDLERECLVDALEERIGMPLTPLRYCHSIAAMAERLVASVRTSVV